MVAGASGCAIPGLCGGDVLGEGRGDLGLGPGGAPGRVMPTFSAMYSGTPGQAMARDEEVMETPPRRTAPWSEGQTSGERSSFGMGSGRGSGRSGKGRGSAGGASSEEGPQVQHFHISSERDSRSGSGSRGIGSDEWEKESCASWW